MSTCYTRCANFAVILGQKTTRVDPAQPNFFGEKIGWAGSTPFFGKKKTVWPAQPDLEGKMQLSWFNPIFAG